MAQSRRAISTFALALLALATLLLYAPRLDDSPVHLHHDEASAALQAVSIADTGRDANGRWLPAYVQVRDGVWLQPLRVYVMTMGFMVSTLSESAIRWPTVIVGTLNVVLMFVLAGHLFKSHRAAIVAAGTLALTPAHFIHSRLALDSVYPVPFITAWLLSLSLFLDRPRPLRLFAAAACLGVGFYSHPTAVLIMPLCWILTCLAIARDPGMSIKRFALAAVGFVLPLMLQLPWFLQYPRTYVDTIGRWGVHPAYLRHPMDGFRAAFNWGPLTERVSLFWDFFSPSYLFFVGGPNMISSTRHAGVFLLPVAVFLIAGLRRMTRQPAPPMSRILLLGFVAAPLIAATFNEREAVGNEMTLLPFAVLIAAAGVEQMVTAAGRPPRIAAICLLLLMPIQFGYFLHDYFTGYRAASSAAFDGNIRGAVDDILRRESRPPARPVFLSSDIPFVESYWKVYLIMHQRQDLLALTTYADSHRIDRQAVPSGSLILGRAGDTRLDQLATAGDIRRLSLVSEPDGSASFAIFERSDRDPSSAPLVDGK